MAHAVFPCCALNKLALPSLRSKRLVVPVATRAAARSEENQSPKLPEPVKQWDDHLTQQQQQSDNYRPPSYGPSDIELARKKFLGRLATLILGAVLLGERITGRGAVEALEMSATGIPLWQIEPVLGVTVLALTAAALWPPRKASPDRAVPTLSDWTTNLTGRVACVGLAGTITAEVLTGKAPLALLNVETGLDSVSEYEAIGAFLILLLLTEEFGSNSDL